MPRARTLTVTLGLTLVAGCERTELPTAVPTGQIAVADPVRAGTTDPPRIVFARNIAGEVGNYEIYSMNPDGSALQRLTTNQESDLYPALSRDRSRIVFSRSSEGNYDIFVMNADGTGQTNLTNHEANDNRASWSPDGSRIAFSSDRDGDHEIYVMDADGSNLVKLTDNAVHDALPAWSPDGTRIAFASTRDGGDLEICVMNADGTDQTNLTNNSGTDFDPTWTPNALIGFTSDRDALYNHVFVMDADGTDVQQLTTGNTWEEDPTWSPDGTQIAMTRNGDVWVIGADGSNPVNVTNTAPGLASSGPDWGMPPSQTPSIADLEMLGNVGSGQGKTLIYTFAARNLGPDGAGAVVLVDPLPAAARFVGVSTTQGSCSGPPVGSSGTVTCALGAIADGEKATVHITVKLIPARAAVTNTASVSSATTDPNPANNALSLATP